MDTKSCLNKGKSQNNNISRQNRNQVRKEAKGHRTHNSKQDKKKKKTQQIETNNTYTKAKQEPGQKVKSSRQIILMQKTKNQQIKEQAKLSQTNDSCKKLESGHKQV